MLQLTDVLKLVFARLLSEGGFATLNVATKTNWDDSVPEIWEKSIYKEADRKAMTSKLAGPDGSDAPINEKMDLSKGPGDKINFTVLRRLVGKGVTGSNTLASNEEKMVVGTFNVTVDEIRHATAADHIATVESLIDYVKDARISLTDWLQRKLDDQAFEQVLITDTVSTIYAGGKSARADLDSGDTLGTAEVKRMRLAAHRRGATPFQETKGVRYPFPMYGAIMSEADYYNLTSDSDYEQDVRFAAGRGDSNPALSGASDMYKGMLLWVYTGVNVGDGVVGSFFRPEAELLADINDAVTTVTAGPSSDGSAVSNVDYWQYFPTSGTNTLLIDNEEITYTATPGDTSLTVSARGAGGSTAAAHSAGALITLNNLGRVLVFGRQFMLRAWAEKPKRIRQVEDYEQELGLGIRFINGVKTVLNKDAKARSAVVMETWAANPNTI